MLHQGADLPLKKFWELENPTLKAATIGNSTNLVRGFRVFKIRPLIPGELAMIIGGTGAGKTAILSNIANSAK